MLGRAYFTLALCLLAVVRFLVVTATLLSAVLLIEAFPAYASLKRVYGSLSQNIAKERITASSMRSRLVGFLMDNGNAVTRDGIYAAAVDEYLVERDELSADFYDGLLVHYAYKEPNPEEHTGIGLAKSISKLVLDKVEINGELVAIERILGVLIWNHPDYNQDARLDKQDAELLYTTHEQIDTIGEKAILYGKIVGVFTDGYLALRVSRSMDSEAGYWRFDDLGETVYTAPRNSHTLAADSPNQTDTHIQE